MTDLIRFWTLEDYERTIPNNVDFVIILPHFQSISATNILQQITLIQMLVISSGMNVCLELWLVY